MGSQNQVVLLQEQWLLENGNNNIKGLLSKEMRHGRTAHNMSSSSLRKKSDLTLVSKLRYGYIRNLLVNFQEVLLGTKLSVLFPVIPFAIFAHCYAFARVSISSSSLIFLIIFSLRILS